MAAYRDKLLKMFKAGKIQNARGFLLDDGSFVNIKGTTHDAVCKKLNATYDNLAREGIIRVYPEGSSLVVDIFPQYKLNESQKGELKRFLIANEDIDVFVLGNEIFNIKDSYAGEKMMKKLNEKTQEIGYYSMVNFGTVNNMSNRVRQITLFWQLKVEKIIKGNEWHGLYDRTVKVNHPVGISVLSNEARSAYIDSIAEELLKDGKIYAALNDLAKGVVERSKVNGGSVVYPTTGLEVATGFTVAVNKNVTAETSELTTKVLEDFIDSRYHDFLQYDDNFLVVRFNSGKWYVEVADVVLYQKTAVEAAKKRGVTVIYDIANKKTICLDDLK